MEDIILYTSFEQALAARKAAADKGLPAALGTTFTTQTTFLKDAWEVWGDGRRLVDNQARCLLLLEVLSGCVELAHVVSDIRPLAAFVARYAGTSSFEEAIAASRASGADGDAFATTEDASGAPMLEKASAEKVGCSWAGELSATESALFAAIGAYLDELDGLGLIEAGRAACLLESMMPPAHIVCDTWLDVPPALQDMIAHVAQAPLSSIMPAPRVEPLPESLEAGFLFPAGPAAVLPMIVDEIEAFCERSRADGDAIVRIAVCVSDPLDVYDEIAPYLAARGCRCAVACTLPFEQTAFGRAVKAVGALCAADAHWAQAVTDFAWGPFSEIAPRQAGRLDAMVRGDRLMTCSEACDLLREQSPTFSLFEGLFTDDALAYAALLKQRVTSIVATGGLPLFERTAGQRLEDLVTQYDQLQVHSVSLSDVVHLATISVAMEAPGEEAAAPIAPGEEAAAPIAPGEQKAAPSAPYVEIRSHNSLGSLAKADWDLLIVADVSDASFKTASSHTAYDALAAKMGLADAESFLNASRAAFACAERAARRRFTCVMPMRDEKRDHAWPSFVLNEYASVLRCGDEPVDEDHFGLPCRIVDAASERGEEEMAVCLGNAFDDTAGEERIVFAPVVRGELAELSLVDFLRSAQGADGEQVIVMSPSAIETYLGCPYRWFVENRVRLADIDEGFGSLEKGTFVHDVFSHLFNELAARGVSHVDEGCLDEAEALLDEIFDARLVALADAPGCRLAPVTASESLEVEITRKDMHVCLRRQAHLPRSFDVAAHELTIAPDAGVDYAGIRLNGRADRVDVDASARRFVVLDYKGGIDGYAAGFSADDDAQAYVLPHKVQALIYAQALRSRFDGYAAAGALYLSYNARERFGSMAGSYDEAAYDVAAFARLSSQVQMNFDLFLDMVEEKIASTLEALSDGDISVRPRDKEACAWCPVVLCAGGRS